MGARKKERERKRERERGLEKESGEAKRRRKRIRGKDRDGKRSALACARVCVCMERACARVIVCDSRCVKEQERRSCRVARRGEVEGREIDRPQDALESFLDTKMAEKIVRSSTSRAAAFLSLSLSLFPFLFFLFSSFFFSPFSLFPFFPRVRDFSPPPPSLFRSLFLTIQTANDGCKSSVILRKKGSVRARSTRTKKRFGRFSTSRNSIRRARVSFRATFDAPSPVVNRSYRCFVYDRLPFVAESSLSYNE